MIKENNAWKVYLVLVALLNGVAYLHEGEASATLVACQLLGTAGFVFLQVPLMVKSLRILPSSKTLTLVTSSLLAVCLPQISQERAPMISTPFVIVIPLNALAVLMYFRLVDGTAEEQEQQDSLMVEIAFEEVRFWTEKLPKPEEKDQEVTTAMMVAYKMLGIYKQKVITQKEKERQERRQRRQEKKKQFEKLYKAVKRQR